MTLPVTADARAERSSADPVAVLRAVLAGLAAILVLVGVVGLLQGAPDAVARQEPLDLDINLVAAQRLVDRAPIYDGPASRPQAVALGGPAMAGAYTRPTNSFVGPPVTALIHVPFLPFGHTTGVALYRLATVLGMLGALALTARILPAGWRGLGFALGAGGLLAMYASVETLELGQGHEFVMLGLALALWASANGRWRLAGAGIAVAAVLKISPVLLLAYLVFRATSRDRRDVIVGFASTAVAMVVAAAVVGRPQDLLVWVRDVAPGLSGGVVRTVNQSLPAFLARLTGSGDLGATTPLGPVRFVAGVGAVLGLALLLRARRGRPFDPLELGVLVLLGLVLGPLSWNHYATWAALPLVLLADPRRWAGAGRAQVGASLGAVLLAVLLLTERVGPVPSGPAGWSARLTTSPYLAAELLLLAVVASRLVPGPEPVAAAGPSADEATRTDTLTPSAAQR